MLLTGCGSSAYPTPVGSTTAARSSSVPGSVLPLLSRCHANGVLPDPVCTPGSINPTVTQATIGATICVKGWTATIRPSVGFTNKLKAQSMKDYGYADINPKDYEEDHRVPLEVGGAPMDSANLWAERGSIPNPKDRVENRVHADVCAGRITLAQGQAVFLGDWTTYR